MVSLRILEMRFIKVLMLSVLIFTEPSGAWCQSFGLDVLGMARINPSYIINNIPVGFGVGVLDGTFGSPYPNLRVILNSKKVSFIRMHLIDGACMRLHQCVRGYPHYSNFKVLGLRARRLAVFMRGYPRVKYYISPWLEHDLKDRGLVRRGFEVVKKYGGRGVLVCSYASGWCPPGVLIERHGVRARGDIVSNDGDSYGPMWGRIIFGWRPEFNGRSPRESSFIYPSRRVHWATNAEVRAVVLELN